MRACWPAALLMLGTCDESELRSDEFCPEYARIECSAVQNNCGVRDEQSCRIVREADCQTEVRRLLFGAKGFNPQGAQDCINKLGRVYSKTFIPIVEWRDVKEACQHAYYGHRGAGDSCRLNLECEQDYYCREGACRYEIIVKEGPEYCSPLARKPCPAGQDCITMSGVSVCWPRTESPGLAIGAACQMDEQCQSPSRFCDPGSGLCATGFAVTPASDFCQPYRRELADAGPVPDARVRADADGDRPDQ